MKHLLFGLALAIGNSASALTVSGLARDVRGDVRLEAWLVSATGAPVQAIASTVLRGGEFRLELPEAVPQKALWVLTPENITWPGILSAPAVNTMVQTSEAKLYLYKDANGDGKINDGEMLKDARVYVGKTPVLLVYVSGNTTVNASRGFQADLQQGWNIMGIDLGKNTRVQMLKNPMLDVYAFE